ncbi:type VI secretion system protein ImpL [Vibrio crassostreae]|uniref:type VI secretion system membrane subunit TssM n=1 Tax=Vibrio crassostreae TaxID=246167 RepID=UPI00104C0934|nr:type VI secretion system membrane subunit TssM [Vibrio crassostreae]NOH77152.1 type VI secretion system membrane subunit TssM [Vibrio crassostreae]TCN92733.1 type VI secretion system protein ImpL [Vibrio crassostreae]CAK2452473.1 type VI secretion system protein ImpL [Vibrio crassostreae]CAK2602338.1 type VI secretion system protein ImpL [Vibrio crassostreae]CAK2602993.1 type VI secretion system protein ImpL [Vibrio crassostreae]
MIKKFVVALIAITLMIVSIAVWFVLPSDTWLWAQVTTSITTFVVLVVMAVWLYQWRNKQRANSDVHEQHVLLKQDTKVIQELFKLAAKKIRGHGTNKLESLYNLPWYIVLGGEKEAKSALLQQNGLEPVLDKHLQDSDSEQYLKFWSCDQAVVIEIGHRIFDSEGVDETLWRITAQQLLKYRPRQGLNGIAAVIGCDRLLQGDQKERQKLSSIYQEAALSMSGALGLSLPMYCLFSKADTIADFVEFFEGYSGCDVENPFGVTFPCEASRRFDKYKFEEMRKTLLKSIANQQFELLRNISSEKAGSVIALPYQLRIFLERVEELLTDIGRENRVREAVWIRGAYLLSSGQKGNEFDLLTQTVADRAEFNTTFTKEQLPGRRSYFASRLFSHVMLPEKRIVGVNEWRHAGYLAARTVTLMVVVGVVSIAGLVMKNNWNQDEQWRADAMTQLRLYGSDIERLESNYSWSDMTAILNELRVVADAGVMPKAWYQQVSVKQGDTGQQIYLTYQEQLNLILLPKLEELISSELFVYVNLGNPTKIFEILRYYQMLFDKQHLNVAEMQTYLLDNLKDQGDVSSTDINALSVLIEDLFNSDYSGRIEANQELIAVATNNLDGLSPDRLIYARIQSLPEYGKQVDIRRQLGEKFDTMFEFADDFHGYLIPEMFTKQGYSQIDLTAKSELLRRQLKDFKAIQGDISGASITELTDLSKQIQRLYFADYVYYWKDLLNNINAKQLTSSIDFAYALNSAREPATSPVLDVLGAVVVNTTLAVEEQPDTKGNQRVAAKLGLKKVSKELKKADKVNRAVGAKLLKIQPSYVVNEAFLSYSNYVNGAGKKGGAVPLDGLIEQFDALNLYFDSALRSSNPGKSFHAYALAHAEGSQDAIEMFQRQGSTAPSQVAKWTKEIADQTWKQVVSGSLGYLNKQWNEQVYQFYSAAVEGRFPFATQGRGEVDLDDFVQFFKPQGRIDQYVDTLLKPFVYWDNGTLKLNEVDGVTLPISANMRAQLRRARQLRQVFFGPTGQELALKFAFRPSSMNTNVTAFQIRESESVFSYRHGPRVWSELNWPTTTIDGYLTTNFYQGDNRVATRAYTGQWALLRALFDGQSSKTAKRLVRKLNYNIDDNQIVIDYTLRDSNQILDKSLFGAFSLPRKL